MFRWRRSNCALGAACLLLFLLPRAVRAPAQHPQVIPLWPEGVPGAIANGGPEVFAEGRVSNVHQPTLTLHPAAVKPGTGTAVIVCPGGGYQRLSIEKEGHAVAAWLNSLGVSAFVLKYRLKEYGHPAPLCDVLRAVRIVRRDAVRWRIDPGRIGVLGFSAGGHLAATAGTLFDAAEGRTGAEIDRVSARPDFLVLVYPVITFRAPYAHSGSRENLLGSGQYLNPIFAGDHPDPSVLKDGRDYYMVLAEGGTAGPPTSHMVVAARSKSIDGPWENSPYNPIIRTKSAGERWWSKGHATLVEGPDRKWYAVYHAYEVEVTIDIDPGATAGLLLFYNRRLYAGLGYSASNLILHRYGTERLLARPAQLGSTAHLRLVNDHHIVTIYLSADGRKWERFGTRLDVSGYHHNVAGEFLSLRPAIYAAGTGEVRFRNFTYRGLP